MKKLLIVLVFCTSAVAAQTADYRLEISWPEGDGQTVTLVRYNSSGAVARIDSVTVARGGAVMAGNATVGEYMLDMRGGMKRIWIDGDTASVTVVTDGNVRGAVITGGENQTVYQRFDALVGQSLVENIRIGTLIRQAGADSVRVAELQREYAANNDGFRAATAELIREYPEAVASAAILDHTTFRRTDEQIGELLAALSPEVQGSPFGKRVMEAVALRIRTRAGAPAMDFVLPAPDGEPVRMADYAGRWVLLDFWSSSCAPCLRAAPIVRAVREKYADVLTIIGVSLDTRREPWIEAIETYGLDWVQASSLEGWDCPVRVHYGVEQMPTMILIDPSGRIADVPPGLTAEQLDETLAKIRGCLDFSTEAIF